MVNEVLENKDAIVGKLVESGMAQDEIDAKIRDKQEEYGGLLTDAGAAYAIAKEAGVDVGFDPEPVMVKINEVKPDVEGVDVEGEVTQVFPVKNWEKNGKKGKVGSVIVKDGTGEIRVTLWNSDCDMIENGEIQRGAKVKAMNCSAKERNGMVELSLGYRGEIKVTEKGMPELTKLSDVAEGMNDVNFAARIERVFPLTEFERQGKKGKVLSMIVSDGAECRLALWDDNANWDGKVREGDTILVEGAYVRVNRGKPELNLGWRGRLIPNPVGVTLALSGAARSEVSGLKGGEKKEIRATVVKVYPPSIYQVCVNCGKKHDGECCGPAKPAMVVNAELDDGTGVVRGVFFREQAEKLVGCTAEEYSKDSSAFAEAKPLGMEMLFNGTARNNEAFDRDEFIVREFHDINVEQEIEMLKGE
ncbi:OB-fold nucleic acid binding domain-containing protein [archaeon]